MTVSITRRASRQPKLANQAKQSMATNPSQKNPAAGSDHQATKYPPPTPTSHIVLGERWTRRRRSNRKVSNGFWFMCFLLLCYKSLPFPGRSQSDWKIPIPKRKSIPHRVEIRFNFTPRHFLESTYSLNQWIGRANELHRAV